MASELATRVKEVQRDSTVKTKWQTYCELFGNNNRDPAKHTDSFLTAFLQSLECLQQSQSEICQIFVGGIPEVPEEYLRKYFSQWGEVTKIEIKQGKGFAFITFSERDAVDEILANHKQHEINGKWVDCKTAENRRHSAMAAPLQPQSPKPLAFHPERIDTTMNMRNRAGIMPFAPIARSPSRPRHTPYIMQTMSHPRARPMQSMSCSMDRQKVSQVAVMTGPLIHNEIFVGGLSTSVSEHHLVEYFSQWGAVTSVEFKHGKGFAFVTFQSSSTVKQIMAYHTNHIINGKWVDCKVAENRRVNPTILIQPRHSNMQSFMQSRLRPQHPPKITHGESVSNQIFVGGLPNDATEEMMIETFTPFGSIVKVEVKDSKGFGFVTFESANSVRQVLARKADINVNGKWVDCKGAEDRRMAVKGS